MTPDEEELLAEYVAEALEQRDAGQTIDPEAICRAHPHLVSELRDALGMVDMLPAMHADTARTDRFVGATLDGRYQLVERIGAGAMGAVYRSRDTELQREVAVKILRHDLFAGANAEQRFLREAESLAAVAHDNVVPVYDRGRNEDGLLYLVMAWVPGASLATVIEWARETLHLATAAKFGGIDWLQERLPAAELEASFFRQCVRWCADVGSALAAAHEAGIIHRDVKPSNVLITTSGRAVLADFGIAARHDDGALTATGTSIGTPWYMAPEQAAGRHEPDPRSDVYSLGATLYHLLGLRPPFDDEPVRVLMRVQTEDPQRLEKVHGGLPRDMQAIVEHAMERDPSGRYENAATMCEDLEAFLAHLPVGVRPLGPIGRFVRSLRRKPSRLVVALMLLAALITWPIWAYLDAGRRFEHLRLRARVPALIAIESYPDKRSELPRAERDEQLALLGSVLELDPEDHATRLMRAAVHQDMGDHRGAARDIAEVRDRAPSAYTRALVERYASVADGAGYGAEVLDLGEMPEFETREDRLIGAFHNFRMRRGFAQAVAWLDEIEGWPVADDLRLIGYLGTKQWRRLYEEAFRLEGVYRRKTARTRHAIGAACLSLKQYEKAIEPTLDALELAPGRHGAMQNLAVAYLKLGRLEEADEMLERAHVVRPWLWNTMFEKAKLLRELGEFDAALEWAERIPTAGRMGEQWKRPLAIARVLRARAIDEYFDSERDRDQRRAQAAITAKSALDHYGQALGHKAALAKAKFQSASPRLEMELMRAIVANDGSKIFEAFLAVAAEDPTNPFVIEQALLFFPDGALTAEQSHEIRVFLQNLRLAVSPR